jgi:glycosyltransferase involved in cell wall biosynthesis
LRILLATSTFLPAIGGAEVAIHNLAEGLVSLGHAAAVCVVQRRGGAEHERSYDLFRRTYPRGLGRTPLYAWWVGRSVAGVCKRWRPDVVHAHFAWPTGYAVERSRVGSGVPIVLTSHGEDIQRRAEVGYGYRLNPRLDRRIRFAVCHADGLTAVGSEVVTEFLNLGADPRHVSRVPNGINWSRLAVENHRARRDLDLPASARVILAVGRNHPKKGFSSLLGSMRLLQKNHPDALCVIVGRDVPRLAALVQELHLHDHVRLYDEVLPVGINFQGRTAAPRDLVETFYKAADVYAMPSLVESAGIVTVEAMAAGLPVVARRAAGAEDLVVHGETGFLTDEGEEGLAASLSLLLSDENLRRRMGRAAQESAEVYDRVRVASAQVETYRLAARQFQARTAR